MVVIGRIPTNRLIRKDPWIFIVYRSVFSFAFGKIGFLQIGAPAPWHVELPGLALQAAGFVHVSFHDHGFHHGLILLKTKGKDVLLSSSLQQVIDEVEHLQFRESVNAGFPGWPRVRFPQSESEFLAATARG